MAIKNLVKFYNWWFKTDVRLCLMIKTQDKER